MKVLLSIKPEYVEKILNGSKKFEFRKSIFKNDNVKSVVVYSTMPIGKVVAEFDIVHILKDTPDVIWKKTSEFSGISRKFFDEYYCGREHAIAIKIGNVRKYDKPMDLKEIGSGITPPQSYRYLTI